MHVLAGAHAGPHCAHVPSLDSAHCLYARAAGSYMHASAGVHGGPKWTHAPEPVPVHVKYAPVPAWNAQVGAGQPTSRTVTAALPEPDVAPEPACEPLPVPRPVGPSGPLRAGFPQPTRRIRASTTAWRTQAL